MSPGVAEEAGKVASGTIKAMSSNPLALALLIVNLCFLGFLTYILGEVSANASERNKSQMDLIARLVSECRAGANKTRSPLYLPLPPLPEIPVNVIR